MPGDVEDLLDECLDALQRGETVEQCLARYPEHSAELEPLLRIAQSVMASPLVDPISELKAETRRSLAISHQASPTEAELQGALDRCIDLLIEGHTPEECLESYPQYANVLESLVQVAAAVRRAFSLEPEPNFKREARRRILTAAGRREHQRLLWGSWPRWAYRGIVALAALLVVFALGSSTVRNASESMPHDLLYPVKEFTEKVELKLASFNEGEAKVHVKLANRRAEEMAEMVKEGDYETLESLMVELEEHLQEVSLLVEEKHKEEAIKLVFQSEKGQAAKGLEFGDVKKLLDVLNRDVKMNSARFKGALMVAPPDMKDEMQYTFQEIKGYYSQTIQDLEHKYSTDELDSLFGVGLAFLP